VQLLRRIVNAHLVRLVRSRLRLAAIAHHGRRAMPAKGNPPQVPLLPIGYVPLVMV
jgi:hypothetical protein